MTCQLEWVRSFEAGLARLEQGGIEVVLLDLLLPDSEGLEAVTRLCGRFPRLPLLVLSGLDNEEVAIEALQLGAQDYLHKDKVEGFWLAKAIRYAIERQKAEVTVRASQRQLQDILDNTPAMIYLKDRGGHYRLVNRHYAAVLHLDRDQIIGKTDYELYSRELAERFWSNDARVIDTRTPMQFEEWFSHEDGLHSYISVKFPLCDPDGTVGAVCGLSTDITARARAEERLQAQYAMTQLLARANTLEEALGNIGSALGESLGWEAAIVWNCAPDTQALRCQEFWRAPSWDAPDFERASRQTTLPGGLGLPGRVALTGQAVWVPDLAQDARSPHETLAAAAGLHAGVGFPIRVGQEVRFVIELFHRSARPVDQGLLELLGSFSSQLAQFLEHARANEALAWERYLLNTLMENIPDPIYFKDTASHFIRGNPGLAARLGSPDTAYLLGKTDFDFFAREHAEPAFQDEQQVIRSGQPIIGKEEKEVWPDGRVAWVSTTKMPLRDPAGRIVGTFGMSRDITARVMAEAKLRAFAARLERSNRDLEEFAWVISHDLQAPLDKVCAFGERLAESWGESLDAKGRDYLQRMLRATQRMRQLIQDLLAYSRVTTRPNPWSAVDLSQVAREVATDLEVRIEQTGAKLELGPLPVLEADPAQMRQLLQNLLGNALKFHRPGVPPVVSVNADLLEEGGSDAQDSRRLCRLTVRDNGIGFDPKYLGRLFTVFVRLHAPEQYEGTGIGLAICRKIAERHGGSITAQSTPGAGSAFIVKLPVKQNTAEPGPCAPSPPG